VVANSIYGQCGSKYSQIFCLEIAESTTAHGRNNIKKGIQFVEKDLEKEIRAFALCKKTKHCQKYFDENRDKLPSWMTFVMFKKLNILLNNFNIKPRIVYGDTDSVFIDLMPQPIDEDIQSVNKEDLVEIFIQIGYFIENVIKKIYSSQLNLRYEKCLTNMFLFMKKRYMGWIYENKAKNPQIYFRGIILQRRDNAKIVKHVYRQILKKIIETTDVHF